MSPELTAALERAKGWWDRATPDERRAMIDAQRESWIRAMAPCEHGDPDWETCPECLARIFPDGRDSRSKPDRAETPQSGSVHDGAGR